MQNINSLIYNNEMYNMVITSGTLKYKVDIARPNTITIDELSKGIKISKREILFSGIYDKTGCIKECYGDSRIIANMKKVFTDEEMTNIFLGMKEAIIKRENTEMAIQDIFKNRSDVRKISRLKYREVNYRLVEKVENYYKTYGIKPLKYFLAFKKLNLEIKDYKCLKTYEQVQEYISSVMWNSELFTAWDTETSGLKFFNVKDGNDKIVGICHSYKPNQGVYIMCRYKGEQILDPSKVMDIMKPCTIAKKIFQNGSFDQRVLRSIGHFLYVDYELTTVSQHINPDTILSKALKDIYYLLTRYDKTLIEEDTIELIEILGPNFDANLVEFIDEDLITVYACGDTDKTLVCFKSLMKMLEPEQIALIEQDMPFYNIVCNADWQGVPVNKVYLENSLKKYEQDREILRRFILEFSYKESLSLFAKKELEIRGILRENNKDKFDSSLKKLTDNDDFKKLFNRKFKGVRQPEFELDYAGDKEKILYHLMDYPKIRYTDTGRLSVGKDYFKDINVYELKSSSNLMKEDLKGTDLLIDDKVIESENILNKSEFNMKAFPLGYCFIRFAEINNKIKIYNRLLENYYDGRTYTTYKYNGTQTGRITNAIQTTPGYARNQIGFSEDDDWGIVDFDYDQVEVRGAQNEAIRMWNNAKEQGLFKGKPVLERYDTAAIVKTYSNMEMDAHLEAASRYLRKPILLVTPKERKIIKRVVFCNLYHGSYFTMASDELRNANNEDEKIKILAQYREAQIMMNNTDIHLSNYMKMSGEVPFIPLPKEKIPYNINSEKVGMSQSYFGRRRYFDLAEFEVRSRNRIRNQGINQPIQSLCRDIVFQAVSNIESKVHESGVKQEDAFSIVFIHDEDMMQYRKSKVNPLWLCAMIYKYGCIRIKGHPIPYYCTPSVTNNWGEAKDDKYEIPKKMLKSLSTDINDYEILETKNHRDYILSKIVEFYQQEVIDYLKDYTDGNKIILDDMNTQKRYYLFRKFPMYISKEYKIKYVDDVNVNNILCMMSQTGSYGNTEVWYKGNKINLTVKDLNEDNGKMLNDIFEETDEFLFEDEDDEFLFDFDDNEISKDVVNRKEVEKLDKTYINVNIVINKVETYKNLFVEEFNGRVTIKLSKNENGRIDKKGFKKIDNLLKSSKNKKYDNLKYDVGYYYLDACINTNVTLPSNFNLKKLDDFITKLRVM